MMEGEDVDYTNQTYNEEKNMESEKRIDPALEKTDTNLSQLKMMSLPKAEGPHGARLVLAS